MGGLRILLRCVVVWPHPIQFPVQDFDVDGAGLNWPDAPVAGFGLEIFILVGGADKNAAPRCIDTISAPLI